MAQETRFDLRQDLEVCSICHQSFPILSVLITESGEIVCKTCEKIGQMDQVMPNVPEQRSLPPLIP